MALKDKYIAKAEEQIKEWQAELDKLAAKAEQAQAETKTAYHDKLSTVKEKQKEAEHKLAELKEAGEESYEKLKDRYETARQEMEKSIEEARAPFML